MQSPTSALWRHAAVGALTPRGRGRSEPKCSRMRRCFAAALVSLHEFLSCGLDHDTRTAKTLAGCACVLPSQLSFTCASSVAVAHLATGQRLCALASFGLLRFASALRLAFMGASARCADSTLASEAYPSSVFNPLAMFVPCRR